MAKKKIKKVHHNKYGSPVQASIREKLNAVAQQCEIPATPLQKFFNSGSHHNAGLSDDQARQVIRAFGGGDEWDKQRSAWSENRLG